MNAVREDLRASYVVPQALPSLAVRLYSLCLLPAHTVTFMKRIASFMTVAAALSNRERQFSLHPPNRSNIMRSIWFLILALALSLSSLAELAPTKPELLNFTQVKTERVVIGSVADISVRYENDETITVIHILEFRTDLFTKEPALLQVRLCGDQSGKLEPAVHTNIALAYNLASQSRLTGCLSLISSESWADSSKWQTVTFNSNKAKRSIQLEKSIQAIINGAVTK